LQGFPFALSHGFPEADEVDNLGLEQADDAFGQGVVIAVANAADRGVDPRFDEPPGIAGRQVLAAPVGMMDQSAPPGWTALTDGLVQGIESKTRGHRGDPPTNNLARKDADDKGHVGHAHPCRQVGEVRDQELVRGSCRVRDCDFLLPTRNTL